MGIAETFKHLLERRKLPPRPEGPLPDKDDPELINTEGERLVGGETLVLYYTDSKGRDSVRRITINQVDENNIYAWCHERLGNRKFRISGVRSLASLDGRVYDNLEEMLPALALSALGQLEPDLLDVEEDNFWHVKDSDELRFYSLKDQYKGEILLLKALARSDGHADEAEDAAIFKYFEERAEAANLKMTTKQEEFVKRWIAGIFPEEFEIDETAPILRKLSIDTLKEFLSAAKNIIVADGKILSEEVELYEKLGKEILAERKQEQ